MIDPSRSKELLQLQLYLSRDEAIELREHLDSLRADPEANEHRHVFSRDGHSELSVSIVTPRKIQGLGYTELETKVLKAKW
jgi:hypothetical protein